MPVKGFKTITVSEKVYDFLYKEWLEKKEEYRLKRGITSFSGYITKRLNDLIEQDKKHIP